MPTSSWISLLAVCFVGAMSPGPSLAAVMKNTVQGSRRHGMVTAVAHAAGIGLYAFLVVTGIAVVITETRWLFTVITWCGAAYLLWLGYQTLTAAPSSEPVSGDALRQLSLQQAALDGFLISFLNPKIAVFLLALFSQIVPPESTTLVTRILIALIPTICGVMWYVLIVAIAGHGSILPALKRHERLINRIFGVVLLAVALRILTL
ncbi:LysE family translocator [Endozoicomonadaceae bacterium StTr2]